MTGLAVGALAGIVLMRDPTEPLAVLAVIASAAVAAGCVTALVGIALEQRASPERPRRGRANGARALRRGLEVGAFVAAMGLLRAADGLTVITGGFVLAGLALAEIVLSARPAAQP